MAVETGSVMVASTGNIVERIGLRFSCFRVQLLRCKNRDSKSGFLLLKGFTEAFIPARRKFLTLIYDNVLYFFS